LWQYSHYGDKIHHNILIDNSTSIRWGQDFSQIYNNISNTNMQPVGKSDGHPVLYNQLIYNNTLRGSEAQYIFRSAADESGYDNFYDVDGSPVGHIHVWVYNNIQSGYSSSYGAYRAMADTVNDNWNAGDAIFDNNLVHDAASGSPYRMGNTSTGTGCSAEYYSAGNFNSCSEQWRGTSGITNWDVDGSLFAGDSGANRFITNPDFEVESGTTTESGGFGGNHPYLGGVTIPSYIGAVNPNDNAWVSGVMNDVTSLAWLRAQADEAPGWIEGGGTEQVKIMGNPTNLHVVQ
jgi:hypothetical protein